MDHAITIGDIVRWVLIGGGACIVIAVPLWVLAAYGRGMSR